MANLQINAKTRTETGKGAARKLRSGERLPAILYGPETDAIMLSLDYPHLRKTIKDKSAENIIFDVRIDSDGASKTKKAMIKEIQKDPVTREFLHIDLYEISMGKAIETDIPIFLINTPVGVNEGGVLQQVRRELKVSCKPEDLVEKLEIDVSGLEIGQSLHLEDISLPPGLESLEDEGVTIATVVSPAILEEVEEEEEIMEEGEVAEAESEESAGEEES